MSELYLILHKVRGEATFDIAIREWYGDEEGWMLFTTEQRCYPHKANGLEATLKYGCVSMLDDRIPDDLPDFHFQPPQGYAREPSPSITKTTARELLAKLGLGTPALRRRKL